MNLVQGFFERLFKLTAKRQHAVGHIAEMNPETRAVFRVDCFPASSQNGFVCQIPTVTSRLVQFPNVYLPDGTDQLSKRFHRLRVIVPRQGLPGLHVSFTHCNKRIVTEPG